MGKELRLSMAMGGGVSLGTFSGGALTQSVKLLVLDGYYHDKYDRIIIDSFSGASAGAISLAIMLRGLVEQTDEQLERAEENLRQELGEVWFEKVREKLKGSGSATGGSSEGSSGEPEDENRSGNESAGSAEAGNRPDKWRELLAIQAAQDLQRQIWVDEIDIYKLLGVKNSDNPDKGEVKKAIEKLDGKASLFSRKTLEELASVYLKIDREGMDFSGRALLGDRVLFACTLTNLSPLTMSSKGIYNVDESGLHGLRDGLRSFNHRDMRVFDIHFADLNEPLRADAGPPVDPVDPDAPAEIIEPSEEGAASSESGSTGGAVDPNESGTPGESPDSGGSTDSANKKLRRSMKYPNRWFRLHQGNSEHIDAEDLRTNRGWSVIAATSIACGAFPGAFEPVILKRRDWEYGRSAWPPQIQKFADLTADERYRFEECPPDYYPFAYADGGAFNNEPIREAFRLSYFMDTLSSAGTDFDRKVLTVDPNVTEKFMPLGVGFANRFTTKSRREQRRDHREKTFDFEARSSLSRLLTFGGDVAGAIQSQSTVNEADKVFQKKNEFRMRKEFIESMKGFEPSEVNPEAIRALAGDIKEKIEEVRRKDRLPTVQVNFECETLRVIRENPDQFEGLEDRIELFLDFVDGDSDGGELDLKAWHKVLMLSHLDLLTGMAGNSEEARLLSVAPFIIENEGHRKLELMGGTFRGFGGFFSHKAREHDYEAGRWAALHYLKLDDPEGTIGRSELFDSYDDDFNHEVSIDELNGIYRQRAPLMRQRIFGLIPGRFSRTVARLFGKNKIDDTVFDLLKFDLSDRVKVQIRVTGLEEEFRIYNSTRTCKIFSRELALEGSSFGAVGHVADSEGLEANSEGLEAGPGVLASDAGNREDVSDDPDRPVHTAIFEATFDRHSERWSCPLLLDDQVILVEVMNHNWRRSKNPKLMIPMPLPELMAIVLKTFDPVLTVDLSKVDLDRIGSVEEEGVLEGRIWKAGHHLVPLDGSNFL